MAERMTVRDLMSMKVATVARKDTVEIADGSEFFELKAETRLALAEALGPGEEATRVAAEATDIYERKGNLVMRDRAARTLTSLRG